MYLSIRQVSKIVGVSYWTVWRLVRKGKLKAIRFNGTWRIEEIELNRFLGKEK